MTIAAVFLLAVPAHAQNALPLSPLSLKSPWGDIPTAPVPRDANGNPIAVPQPTEAEREAARQAEARRVEKVRQEERERRAAEARREADERHAAALLAEEKSFHDRIMTAVYVSLALLAAWVATRVFKRSG